MIPKIILIGHSNEYGSASFSVDGIPYGYKGIDGPALNRIIALERNKHPGQALNIAKRNSSSWRKNYGEWKDIT